MDRLAEQALHNVCKAFPHGELVQLSAPDDLMLPREAHPIFYGAWDWHSAVENHWLMICLLGSDISWAVRVKIETHFDAVLTSGNVEGEAAFFAKLSAFEMPYGGAWYLKFVAALEGAQTSHREAWAGALAPLTALIEECLMKWLANLGAPMRNGLHSQTAFGLTLWLESARARGRAEDVRAIEEKARVLYGGDIKAMLAFEPQPHDFLSPSLAEAELMATVLEEGDYRSWLVDFGLAEAVQDWTQLCVPEFEGPDKYRLGCHLIGLCFSRAWALDRIAMHLPQETRPRLWKLADDHREAVEDAIFDDAFIIAHWVPCYAWYDAQVRETCRQEAVA